MNSNNIRTIIKHYENHQVLDFTDELVKQKRLELNENGFITLDDEDLYRVDKDL